MSLANNTAAAVLAFGWAPEIRGILFVTIGVVALCGSAPPANFRPRNFPGRK